MSSRIGPTFRKSFSTSPNIKAVRTAAENEHFQKYSTVPRTSTTTKPSETKNRTVNVVQATPKVTVDIVSAQDPAAQEGLDLIRRVISKDVSIHEKAAPYSFVFLVRSFDDDCRIVASSYLELYDSKDLCSDSKALEHSKCPAVCRPYLSQVASILDENKKTSSRVAYGCYVAFCPTVRGKNVVGVMNAKLFWWFASHNVHVFFGVAPLQVMTKFWFLTGYRPLGNLTFLPNIASAHGPPQDGMVVPNAILLKDHQYLQDSYPGLAHHLKKVQAASSNDIDDQKAIKALYDRFPLLAANAKRFSEADIKRKLCETVFIEDAKNQTILQAFETRDLAKILKGAIELEIKAGDALVPQQDFLQKDCILLLSGEMAANVAASNNVGSSSSLDDTRVIRPGRMVYHHEGSPDLFSESKIVAVKDSRLLILSSMGAKQFHAMLMQYKSSSNILSRL